MERLLQRVLDFLARRELNKPTSDELADLRNLVVSSKCDLGLAFDLDGDRLVVVDKKGEKLNPDTTLVLCVSKAIEMGAKNIVISADTSNAIKELASMNNCGVNYSKVGEANVINVMLQNRIVMGEREAAAASL